MVGCSQHSAVETVVGHDSLHIPSEAAYHSHPDHEAEESDLLQAEQAEGNFHSGHLFYHSDHKMPEEAEAEDRHSHHDSQDQVEEDSAPCSLEVVERGTCPFPEEVEDRVCSHHNLEDGAVEDHNPCNL